MKGYWTCTGLKSDKNSRLLVLNVVPLRIICLLIGFLLLFAPVAGAQNVLDMTVSPSTLGWGTVTSGGATITLASNVLTIDSPLNGFGGYNAPSAAWSTAVGNPSGWEVEVRVRLTDHW